MYAHQGLFQTRSKIFELRKELNAIEETCKCKCSKSLLKRIDSINDELEGLKIRRFILQHLCDKCLLV